MKKISTISLLCFVLYSITLSQIYDIKEFLDQCPTNDPVIDTILKDFEIRLNNEIVTEFPCTEPVASIPVSSYSNPLIYLQTLRVIYYMDKHMANHLPWTDTTLYVWMKERVDGINIKDGVAGGYCCEEIDGKIFFVTGNADDFNRGFDKKWIGIAGNIDFFAHEVRHTEGNGYYHSSCCGIASGCDEKYDEADLGAYGIQHWLNKSWLDGFINVGARTSHNTSEINEIINWHLGSANAMRNRFCQNIPELINLEDIELPLGAVTTSNRDMDWETITLFPNPIIAGQEITIISHSTQIDKIEVFNTGGVLVKIIDDPGINEVIFNTRNLPPDIYILKILDSSENMTFRKLIVH